MSNKKIRGIFTENRTNPRNKYPIAALNELMKDTALIRHRKTLDEISRAMTRAMESDQKWSSKCQKLETDLILYESKIKTALQLSEEDKTVIDTLNSELENSWRVIDDLKSQNLRHSEMHNSPRNKNRMNKRSERKNILNDEGDMKVDKENMRLLDELEKEKLKLFELEEQLASKEKQNDDLVKDLNSKLVELSSTKIESDSLKKELQEYKILCNSVKDLADMKQENELFKREQQYHQITSNSTTESKFESDAESYVKSNFSKLQSFKKQLLDLRKRNKIFSEKLKYLLKRNKLLSRQLQVYENRSKLLNLQLNQQNKNIDLISCHCCKLEEKDRKQLAAVEGLEKIRNRHVQTIGRLEEEIHNLKKEILNYKVKLKQKG